MVMKGVYFGVFPEIGKKRRLFCSLSSVSAISSLAYFVSPRSGLPEGKLTATNITLIMGVMFMVIVVAVLIQKTRETVRTDEESKDEVCKSRQRPSPNSSLPIWSACHGKQSTRLKKGTIIPQSASASPSAKRWIKRLTIYSGRLDTFKTTEMQQHEFAVSLRFLRYPDFRTFRLAYILYLHHIASRSDRRAFAGRSATLIVLFRS